MKSINTYIIEKFKITSTTVKRQEKKIDNPTTWDVGDILVATWGYNMIIVDFYEITKATGKSFIVRKLKYQIVSGDGNRGECVPDEGKYEDDKFISCRINKYNLVKIKDHYASLWNGKPH